MLSQRKFYNSKADIVDIGSLDEYDIVDRLMLFYEHDEILQNSELVFNIEEYEDRDLLFRRFTNVEISYIMMFKPSLTNTEMGELLNISKGRISNIKISLRHKFSRIWGSQF